MQFQRKYQKYTVQARIFNRVHGRACRLSNRRCAKAKRKKASISRRCRDIRNRRSAVETAMVSSTKHSRRISFPSPFFRREAHRQEKKSNDAIIENMTSWRHTEFHVHVGARIFPEDEIDLGNLAKYIFRASFFQERMLWIPAEKSADGSAKVVY